jgi:hypothetical protein
MLFGEKCDPLPDPNHPFGNHDAPYLAGFAVAPFFSSNGTWNEPLPTKLSNSNIKVGSDFMVQSRLENPFISTYLYVSPYYQTDYQNRARIEGSVFALEPVIPALMLDSSRPTPYYSFFWQWRGEIDTVHVTVPGLTKLSIGDHLWIGETAVANFALFPAGQPLVTNKFVEEYIVGRFSVIGTAKTFYDTRTGINADYYSAMLQYKLGECKTASGSDPSSPCAIRDLRRYHSNTIPVSTRTRWLKLDSIWSSSVMPIEASQARGNPCVAYSFAVSLLSGSVAYFIRRLSCLPPMPFWGSLISFKACCEKTFEAPELTSSAW